MSKKIPISLAAALLGLSTSALRKWEMRYGFPIPQRDENENRTYDLGQFELLRFALKLINSGEKPSAVFSNKGKELEQRWLLKQSANPLVKDDKAPLIASIYNKLRQHDINGCRNLFKTISETDNLNFLDSTINHLLEKIGNAWLKGELEVYQEHLISDIVNNFLKELSFSLSNQNKVSVLLCTPSSEYHTLGLSMVEYALKYSGANCINLGANLPVKDLLMAVKNYQCQIVAISTSNYLKKTVISNYLQSVRDELDSSIEVWVGGNGIENIRKPIEGVKYFVNTQSALEHLNKYLS